MESSKWGEINGEESKCRSCGAVIQWVTTRRGKKMPVDPDTDESHYKTCPQATDWSQKGKDQAPAQPSQREDRWKELIERIDRLQLSVNRLLAAEAKDPPAGVADEKEEIPF